MKTRRKRDYTKYMLIKQDGKLVRVNKPLKP